jgi:polyphenol oxidase
MNDGIRLGGGADMNTDRAPAYLEAANLKAAGVSHGFFLRTGGVSEGIFASLNCGRGSGDLRERVEENRGRVAETLGAAAARLIGPHQCHSPNVAVAHAPWPATEAPHADAVVTATPGLAVSVLTADCAPVLLADASAGVVAAVHAGWKGAKAGVIESAVRAMESLGASAGRISAAIGPAISQPAYEVGPEFRAAFVAGAPENERYFFTPEGGRPHFNLTGYVADRLAALGVATVHLAGVCTYENESILFSYRRSCHRSEPDYGRQVSAILLR